MRFSVLSLDAVIVAAILASGFVYVRPFVDGHGRINAGSSRPASYFPVSAAIPARIDCRLLPFLRCYAPRRVSLCLRQKDDRRRPAARDRIARSICCSAFFTTMRDASHSTRVSTSLRR